jgi:[protein-PII] uridylyltransferase
MQESAREFVFDDARIAAAIVLPADSAASDLRPRLIEALRRTLADGRAAIRRDFENGATGATTVRANCRLIDGIVRAVLGIAANRVYPSANPTQAERIAVAAVGGYGRGELAPFSDVDLLFLLPYKETPRTEQIIEYTLYALWDLGLKVGHATRPIAECIRLSKADNTICTSILEARYLWGETALYQELRKRFDEEVVKNTGAAYVSQKLAERDERHRRLGGSRYVLEPNVKEGKGGLRDLQTLYWIAKYLYRVDDVADLVARGVLSPAEARRFDRAQEFFWVVRCWLHYLAGRAEDHLTFDMQVELARRMGYRDRGRVKGVERFMRHYYLQAKDVGDLTRIFCAALEAEHRSRPRIQFRRLWGSEREIDGFPLEAGRVSVKNGEDFARDPVKMLRLFHAAQWRELDIHPRALRHVTRHLRLIDSVRDDPEANRLFLEMLTSQKDPETTLRRLNEAGIFGRFVPDFGRVVAQMQHDLYHVYTVDEHTIFAIGILAGVEAGKYTAEMPVISEAVHKISEGSRRALYVALLLHDIGKGRGGDHSEIGAGVALRLGPRFGLSAEETETASWLVRYHLVMSNTAFKYDISDPKTITDFIGVVQSVERLRLLTILTACDIRAVGPNVWNGWKAALLRDLYYMAEEVMTGGMLAEGREARVKAAQGALRAALADWAPADIEVHLARGYPTYWLGFDAETHVRHARLVAEAERSGAPLTIEKRVDAKRAVTEITIYTPDHPGLFARIAGAMALAGANIVDAKIHTLSNGKALDTFWVQDAHEGGPLERPEKLARLAVRIEDALTKGPRHLEELVKKRPIPERTRAFAVQPRVIINNNASRTHTVIEVNGLDRPGFLFDVTRTLTALNLQIFSARISTFGERAVDVFYVKNAYGVQETHEGKLKQIRAALLEALGGAPEPAREPAAAAQ